MKHHLLKSILCVCIITITQTALAEPTNGPLQICKSNPRYFADQSGNAVLLTGSHVWYNLVDMGPTDPPPVFDYSAHLDWMLKYNNNFMRMWTWEMTQWNTEGNNAIHRNKNTFHYVQPHIYSRSGEGKALDGKPKFDLSKFNKTYFERLRQRVKQAGEQGIYVSIMLFEGWAMQRIEDGWKAHPFNSKNNINNIDGDKNNDGKGLEVHELVIPEITKLQETYVKKVIDTVNDLDNVLYEISNENHPQSTAWQYHMIEFIKEYEKTKPHQHPVGMTFQFKGGKNQDLFDSPADWISPNPDGGYRDNPPAADGSKVIVTDTDHLWGIGGNTAWVWKSVCRGMNPIFMDPYDGIVLGNPFDERWEPIRENMGIAKRVADRLDFTAMKPHNKLASTGYCLAEPKEKYVIFLPEGETVQVTTSADRTFRTYWINVKTYERQRGERVNTTDETTEFESPFGKNETILILRAVRE
jgi:hypothetical protein